MEDRRGDDKRITDIKESCHDMDIRLTRVEAKQEAFEKSQVEAHHNLHARIDAIKHDLKEDIHDGFKRVSEAIDKTDKRFIEHANLEEADRRKFLFWGVTAFITWLGYIVYEISTKGG